MILDTPQNKSTSKVRRMEKILDDFCIENGLPLIKKKEKADPNYTISFKKPLKDNYEECEDDLKEPSIPVEQNNR